MCPVTLEPGDIDLFIWARIDDQRQRSFAGPSARPSGVQDRQTSEAVCLTGHRQRVAVGGQTPLPVAAITERDRLGRFW
jgi:hypothetical protein